MIYRFEKLQFFVADFAYISFVWEMWPIWDIHAQI